MLYVAALIVQGMTVYFCAMLILLFGRYYIGGVINLKISGLFDFSFYAVCQNLFNILFFVPAGFLFKQNHSLKFAGISALLFVVQIEILQFTTKRGIFDLADIVLNVLGILLGFILSKHIPEAFNYR